MYWLILIVLATILYIYFFGIGVEGLDLPSIFQNLQANGFDGIAVDNAYTNTKCVKDDLPLVRFYPTANPATLRCLSVDGQNCITRQSIGVPSNYTCDDSAQNVNKYLSADGIRTVNINKTTPLAKVYYDYENLKSINLSNPTGNINVSFLTCTPDGLKNPNHWCGQTWSAINSQCSGPKGLYGEYNSICKNLPLYLNNPNVGTNVTVTNYSAISQNLQQALAAQNTARQTNVAAVSGRAALLARKL